ncbi:unnamed protein product [Chilo suppressalis]|uniref:Insulin-like domain-containing protein n=1 Tax=Chilo suppressalis TaxID=168631 RepID=A0ABN8L520_CHISP|nr:unnamed protein product [Chilo suppressalis]
MNNHINMRASVVFVLVIASLLCATSGKAPAQFFCGRRLADTLALFCPSAELVKRSGHHGRWHYPGNEVLGAGDEGWLHELGFGGAGLESWLLRGALSGSRGKRGVISECCDQPCTIEELLTYC